MKTKTKIVLSTLLSIALIVWGVLYLQGLDIPLLFPKGMIGVKQRNLLVISTLLMLIVVIPVFILTIFIVWKYRADNTKAKHEPDWDNSSLAETIWWGLPFLIVIALSVLVWNSSHELNPFKPLVSETKPIRIQAVALQWRWLFIYPEQKIASLSYVQFPQETPLNFEITSDAPMNSFWIPDLGGQIYAMPGMRTQMHLIANQTGNFKGLSANLSGTGFSAMTFTARASTQEEFDQWVDSVKSSGDSLTRSKYIELQKPSRDNAVQFYDLGDEGLFNWIIMKYMMPQKEGMESLGHN